MIVDLPKTTTAEVASRLVRMRDDVGAMALTRVLTLVIVVDDEDVDGAIEAANDASRQHPCRIIVLGMGNGRGAVRLDAQIRVGGDAGASEVIVLRMFGELTRHARSLAIPFLLADCPIVVWWPGDPPASPAQDPVGEMAQRRITDATRGRVRPRTVLGHLAGAYEGGDTDLAWSRISLWRALIAATLDSAPYDPVTEAVVSGATDSPSVDLLAGWLAHRLRCPVTIDPTPNGTGVGGVRLERRSGPVTLDRPTGSDEATLRRPGSPDRTIALPRRSDAECLADELRHLDADETYAAALCRGLPTVMSGRRSSRKSKEKS